MICSLRFFGLVIDIRWRAWWNPALGLCLWFKPPYFVHQNLGWITVTSYLAKKGK